MANRANVDGDPSSCPYVSDVVHQKVSELRSLARSLMLLAESTALVEYKRRLLATAGRLIQEAVALEDQNARAATGH
jgi:hypothetical protein